MSNHKLRFDSYVGTANTEPLKKMARIWGGNYKLRKAESIALICQGLANPQKVKEVVASLADHERTALALAKQMGGVIGIETLALGLRASGVSVPTSKSEYDRLKDIVRPLVEKGLFLSNSSWGLFYLDGYGGDAVFSDSRLLDAVDSLTYEPVSLTPNPNPVASTFRQGAVVSLELIGILQAIENLVGLGLTKSGDVRVNDLRKLTKVLKWKNDKIAVDGMTFPQPASCWVNGLFYADCLTLPADGQRRLVLKHSVDKFASLSYREQIAQLLWGMLQVHQWQEGQFNSWISPKNYANGRLALTLVLKSIPVDTESFWAIDELDQAMYDRVGRDFSLGNGSRFRPMYYGKTPEEQERLEAERFTKQRQEWLKCERQWLEKALTTWLYYLGIIELGLSEGKPVSFRLTPLGKQVLHPELEERARESNSSSPQPTWIVQPNFEIVVYLSAINSQQLAFLERHAERVKVEQHVAIYRLTRESVYHALEKGSSLTELLEQLQVGASVPLPQNVEVDLRSWGQLREEISLDRQAKLLEFHSEKARQAALDKGQVQGKCVGDRFLLLEPAATLPKALVQEKIDYAKRLLPCLSVTESGTIQLTSTPDFLLPEQLDKWAKRQSDGTWQLTAATVKSTIQAGGKITELFDLLEDRLTHAPPEYLVVALNGWAGKFKKVELAKVVVLHCPDAAVFELIVEHQKFKNYWLGVLAYGILLVESSQVKAVKKQLAQLGLTISDELAIE